MYVTGFSGRFPLGYSSVADFWEHLCHQRTDISADVDDIAFQQEKSELFLGHSLKQYSPSPSLPLLQVVYEAICDASYSREDLMGTNTAVYTSLNMDMRDDDDMSGEVTTTSSAEQISTIFGLRGPAVVVNAGPNTDTNSHSHGGGGDTGGGLVALDLAVQSIRSGVVTRALVVDGDWTDSAGGPGDWKEREWNGRES